jgi:2-C-methyl-D-erythritol 4-phosphate cytidylyltransferase
LTKEYALIVAGGMGTRFGSPTPKQFLELRGKPVLMHTLETFYRYSENINIVLVLPSEAIPVWQSLVSEYGFNHDIRIVNGGTSRFQSVKNGLKVIHGQALIAIHDGVRPLVTPEMIGESFRLAAIHGSAIASVPLKESLRVVEDQDKAHARSSALDRSRYRIIQTPQTFQGDLIKRAYETDEDQTLTDDASVAERAGFPIHLFQGSYENIKITTPEDLMIADALMRRTDSL